MAFHMNFNLDFPSSLTAEPLDGCRGGIGNPFDLLNRIFREDDLGANETDVVETEEGYLISAHVPGVTAERANVVIERGNDGLSRLSVTIEETDGDENNSSRNRKVVAQHSAKSHLVDVANARASLIDGILRVAVPKVTSTENAIPVFPESPFPEPDIESNTPAEEEDDDGGVEIGGEQLHVPGYAAADIKITERLPHRELVIEGDNAQMGRFETAFSIPDGVDCADNVSAWCQNGILNLRFEVRRVERGGPRDISVSDDRVDADEANHVTVLEHAVPGMAAGDINVQVDREGKMLKATGKTTGNTNACQCLFVIRSLPSGVDPNTVRASCVDGLLKVVASKPEPPVKHDVEVSATNLACIGRTSSQECQ